MTQEEFALKLVEMLKRAKAEPCLICNGPSETAGLFVPSEAIAVAHKVPADRRRIYAYGLCADHNPEHIKLKESLDALNMAVNAAILKKILDPS